MLYDIVPDEQRFATCTNTASTATKVITLPAFTSLTAGARVYVSFSSTNTATAPLLQVNSLEAKPIYKSGSDSYYTNLRVFCVYGLIYDGTYWRVFSDSYKTTDGLGFDSNSNLSRYIICYTTATTAEKTVTYSSDFRLLNGALVVIRFYYGNSAASPTLNVNGTGAKPICANKSNAKDYFTSLIKDKKYLLMYDSASSCWRVLNGDIESSDLDETETGTATLTNSGNSSQTMTVSYIKRGNQVTITKTSSTTSTVDFSGAYWGGLPFVVKNKCAFMMDVSNVGILFGVATGNNIYFSGGTNARLIPVSGSAISTLTSTVDNKLFFTFTHTI